jgi:glutamate N-acetyltransferase/amino-acid N-acetyltransferase
VRNAADVDQARAAARTVASSPLVKTAIHGGDPNWGRIVAAVGRSGAQFSLDSCTVYVGGIVVLAEGTPVDADLDAVRAVFSRPRIDIDIDLGAGAATGHAWGCDLSAEYVHINADYTT